MKASLTKYIMVKTTLCKWIFWVRTKVPCVVVFDISHAVAYFCDTLSPLSGNFYPIHTLLVEILRDWVLGWITVHLTSRRRTSEKLYAQHGFLLYRSSSHVPNGAVDGTPHEESVNPADYEQRIQNAPGKWRASLSGDEHSDRSILYKLIAQRCKSSQKCFSNGRDVGVLRQKKTWQQPQLLALQLIVGDVPTILIAIT